MNIKNSAIAFGLVAVASQAQLLWDLTVPDLQVQVPCVINGTPSGDNNSDGNIDQYDCGGWWFGYGFGPEGGAVGTYTPADAAGALITTDPADGSIIPGGNITATGIKIVLNTPAGAADAPTGAGIGFQYNKPEGPTDLSAKPGYCLTYTSDKALQFELGWDEPNNGYDSWYSVLPVAAAPTTVVLDWDLTKTTGTISGKWKKDGWDKVKSFPITTAVSQAWSVKIRLKNGTATPSVANVEIQNIGYGTACSGGVILPTLGNVQGTSLKANLSGRSLAFAGLGKKSLNVQVLNLQGQVVASDVISSAKASLNLSRLVNGIYLVRAAGKDVNFTQKVILK